VNAGFRRSVPRDDRPPRHPQSRLINSRFPGADQRIGLPGGPRTNGEPFSKESESRRSHRKGGLLRVLGWLAFLPLASRGPTYVRLIWALVMDDRVPASRKVVLAGAAGYVLLGRDLIPDDIPVLGGLDDLAVVILAVEVFFDGIPEEILEEKLEELAIDRVAFRRDMDQVRRLTPAPSEKDYPSAARRASTRQPAYRQSRDRTESSIVHL